MSRSDSENLIQNIVRKHGKGAEAPAREVAQAYEQEIRRMEEQYAEEAKQIERDLSNAQAIQARENERTANKLRSGIIGLFFTGFGGGMIVSLWAVFEFGFSDTQLLIGGFFLCIMGLVAVYS
jgi:hypothetical protein